MNSLILEEGHQDQGTLEQCVLTLLIPGFYDPSSTGGGAECLKAEARKVPNTVAITKIGNRGIRESGNRGIGESGNRGIWKR